MHDAMTCDFSRPLPVFAGGGFFGVAAGAKKARGCRRKDGNGRFSGRMLVLQALNHIETEKGEERLCPKG